MLGTEAADVSDSTQQFSTTAVLPERPRVGVNSIASVIVYDGDEIGALFSLTREETVFGRTCDCDVVLTEDRVSRRHAAIRRTEDDYELVDLNSTNGTCLNGEPVTRALLRDGDKIAIGGSTLKFAFLDEQDLSFQSKIVEMIHVDDLTGLLTKRSLFRGLEKELIRAERYGRPVSVFMMDIDHFKQVNDTHGHLVGSACLAEVGKVIRESTRAVDVNGRYGGEEFVSYLPETASDEAMLVADRIRESLAGRWFRFGEVMYRVEISIGVAAFPEHGRTVEELVHAADLALYRAKNTGRNRVSLYDSSLTTVR